MARARNTASAKDLCKAFRSYSTDLDAARFRDDIDVLIERHEVLLADILEETRRPTEKVRCQSLTLSYECGRSVAELSLPASSTLEKRNSQLPVAKN